MSQVSKYNWVNIHTYICIHTCTRTHTYTHMEKEVIRVVKIKVNIVRVSKEEKECNHLFHIYIYVPGCYPLKRE